MCHIEHHPNFMAHGQETDECIVDEHLELALTVFDTFQHLAETPRTKKKRA
jgi:hypothetical protein